MWHMVIFTHFHFLKSNIGFIHVSVGAQCPVYVLHNPKEMGNRHFGLRMCNVECVTSNNNIKIPK